jgi:hypothetical protein
MATKRTYLVIDGKKMFTDDRAVKALANKLSKKLKRAPKSGVSRGLNSQGLTWPEWKRAARSDGGIAHIGAWKRGEDPSEYRLVSSCEELFFNSQLAKFP